MFGLPFLTGKFIVYAFLALALMGAIGTGVYKVKQWGANEVRLEWNAVIAEQVREDLERGRLATLNRESDRAKSKELYRTIKETVVEYIDRPVYSTICIDPDGLRDINRALSGEDIPSPGTGGGVPKVTSPSGTNR